MHRNRHYGNIGEEKNPAATVIFWMAAFFAVFWVLGGRALNGSEDRWAEISRGMLMTGDYFHPFINHENYFDKPLLSYWFISGLSYLCGVINEWTIRVPSALSALAALWALRRLAMKLWDKKTAYIASWIMLTSLGFIFWARKADADMENMAAITLAVMWFFECKDKKPGFFSYLLFYAICFLGAQAKGLASVAVPLALVCALLFREKSWKKHFNFQNIGAFVVGCVIYLVPFVYAGMTRPDASGSLVTELNGLIQGDRSSGLYMVFRENVERFFTPFDHKEGPHAYFLHLPRILAPWTLIFLAALASFFMDWKKSDLKKRWLLDAVIIIFLMFTASGSRRWYYILPILPFCSLMTAVFIAEARHDKLRKPAFLITGLALFAVAFGMLMSPLVWHYTIKLKNFTPPHSLYFMIPAAGIIAGIPWFIRKPMPGLITEITGLPRLFAPYALSVYVMMTFSFVIMLDEFDSLRTEKAFALELKNITADVEPSKICFFRKVSPAVLFYMDRRSEVTVAAKPEDAEKFIASSANGFFISQRKFFEDLPEDVVRKLEESPLISEKVHSWDSKSEHAGKLVGITTSAVSP